MHLIPRALIPVLAAAAFALSGCQTPPTATESRPIGPHTSAEAGRAVQPVTIHLARAQPEAGFTAVTVPGGTLYLQSQPLLTRADLTDAAALTDRRGEHYVGLRLTPDGAQKLEAVSRQNAGGMLAVVIGRELVAAPRISGPLDRGVMAFGTASADTAADLAARIRGDAAR